MCTNSFNLRLSTGRVIEVSCGKCPECLKRKQNNWFQRSVEEARYYQNLPPSQSSMYFITLTYDDEHLPFLFGPSGVAYPCLHYDHVNTLWRTLKMHHKSNKEKIEFSYMYCGENGTKHGRPHYHILCFGLRHKDIEFIKKWWLEHFAPKAIDVMNAYEVRNKRKSQELGVVVTKCRFTPNDYKRVSKYVSKYVSKGRYDKYRISRPLSDIPRVYASRGYGSRDLDKWVMSIPRYLRQEAKIWKYDEVAIVANKLRWNNGFFELLGKCTYSRLAGYFLDRLYYLNDKNEKVYFLRKPTYNEWVPDVKESSPGVFENYSRCVTRVKDEDDASTWVHPVSHLVVPHSRHCVTKARCSLRAALVSYLQKENDLRFDSDFVEFLSTGASRDEAFKLSVDKQRQESEVRYAAAHRSLIEFYTREKDNQ